MSVLIQKASAGERNGTESAGAVIEIQRVHLPVFLECAIGADGESAHQIGIADGPIVDSHDGRPALHGLNLDRADGLVANSPGAIVGHIQVQVPIAIDVGQGQRGAAPLVIQRRRVGLRGEVPLAVIDENVCSASQRIDDQVQVPIAVDVSEYRAGRVQGRAGHSGSSRNVLEFPTAKVAVEHIRPIQTAEVKIAQTIAIHVPGSHTRAVEKDRVGEVTFRGQTVGHKNARR